MSTLRAPNPPLSDNHVVLRPLAEEDIAVVGHALTWPRWPRAAMDEA
jgi:hypothetical protein